MGLLCLFPNSFSYLLVSARSSHWSDHLTTPEETILSQEEVEEIGGGRLNPLLRKLLGLQVPQSLLLSGHRHLQGQPLLWPDSVRTQGFCWQTGWGPFPTFSEP